MKHFILFLSLLFIGGASADSIPTSVGYVDTAISALQNKISAVDNNTVLTTTNTAGEIGQKSIYDANGNYATQQNALVTAAVANAAVQNAIDGEFVCIEWLDGAEQINENCLIYEIRAAKLALVPTEYTPLEYLRSKRINGNQADKAKTDIAYIDTGIKLNANSRIETKFSIGAASININYAIFGASNGQYYNQGEIALFWNSTNTPIFEPVKPTANTSSTVLYHPEISADTIYTISYDKNYFTMNGATRASNWYSNYAGTRNLTIFATNRGADTWGSNDLSIYYFKVFDNETLIFSGIPVRRNSDGELGMYDFVSGNFFTNVGTGEFIAGPDLNVYLPGGN